MPKHPFEGFEVALALIRSLGLETHPLTSWKAGSAFRPLRLFMLK